jgi:succinoglycan biosynthesis transport protein ExoP
MAKYEMNLRDYLRVLKKRKFYVLAMPILVGLFTFLITPTTKPLYRAISSVKITKVTSIAGFLLETITFAPGDTLETQCRIIESQPIMIGVAKKLKLIPDVPDEVVLSKKEYMQVINKLQQVIKAAPAEKTSIIELNAFADTPDRAIKLVNTTAEVYQEKNTYERNRQAIEKRKFIERQLAIYEKRLKEAEERLKNFKESTIDKLTLSADEAVSIKRELDSIRKERETITTQIGQLNERKEEKVEGRIDWMLEDENNPTLQKLNAKLIELQIRKGELLRYYTPDAPEVAAIEKEIEGIISNIVKEYGVRLSNLEKRDKDLSSRLTEIPEKAIKLAELERTLKLNEESFLLLKSKYQEALIAESEKIKEVEIVHYATNAIPVNRSTKGGRALLGALVGIFIGLVLAFVVETFDTSIGTIEDVETYLDLQVLGVIPHIDTSETKEIISETYPGVKMNSSLDWMANLVVVYQPNSPVAEAFRSLRTKVEFTKIEKGGRFFSVTSSTLEEGKSTIVSNLALSTAQVGRRTLLLGCDWRRPSIYRMFGLSREPGLTDVLLGTTTLEETIHNFTDFFYGNVEDVTKIGPSSGLDNLYIITCGTIPPNPAELLSSARMKELLRELSERFDVVFADSPPVLPVADAVILGSNVDGTILVYKLGKVGRGVLKRAKAHLDAVEAPVIGVVLNDLRAEVSEFAPEAEYYYKYYAPPEKEGLTEKLSYFIDKLKKSPKSFPKTPKAKMKKKRKGKGDRGADSEYKDILDITEE